MRRVTRRPNRIIIAGMNRYSPCTRMFALVLIVFLSASPYLEARVEPTHGFDIFSQDEEIQLGKQSAAEVMKQLPVLPDSDPVTQYVQKLGGRLAARAPGYQWPYNFHVVNVKEINAFALPGGSIFINLGTIQAADNEAQLAGVMSHEISHVVQRHGTRAASKQMGAASESAMDSLTARPPRRRPAGAGRTGTGPAGPTPAGALAGTPPRRG